MSLPIRSGLLDIQGSSLTSSDAPSLLFYYLFDDWFTSYSLVAKQEHQYGKQLGLLVRSSQLSSTSANWLLAREHV